MGHSQTEKAVSRERVLRKAARKIREEGVSRPSIADLMKEAGLTHGGFYKHFASRDEFIAQAAVAALADGSAKMEKAARLNKAAPRAGLIEAYLSKQHRDVPGTGCALVTLGAAAGRGGAQFKDAYEQQVRTYLDLLAGLTQEPDSGETRNEALLILSAMVGAVLMARAVADPELSDEILTSVASELKRLG